MQRFCETRGRMTTLAEEGREETLPFSTYIIVLDKVFSLSARFRGKHRSV
jgi:hypothetical protein